MVPMLYRHLKQLNTEIPEKTALQLKSLVLRHQQATKVRTKALTEILQTLAANDIPVIVLKGAALAYTVYPVPELRPMSDIDVLVDKDNCQQAQRLLTSLDYRGAALYRTGVKFDHHHMAIAKKKIDGLTISVEVHRDALSPDAIGSLTFDTLKTETQLYAIGSERAQHLGHIDMLLHLCRHLAEPADETRLISIVDVYAYADKFFNEIDWQYVKQRYSFVHNALRCLQFISPLPEKLHGILNPPLLKSSIVAGFGVPTLSSISGNYANPRQTMRRIFCIVYPPKWWLHLYYNLEPERESVIMQRLITHPSRMLYWFAWRIRALTRYYFFKFTNRLNVKN